jgi:hypothetical protein
MDNSTRYRTLLSPNLIPSSSSPSIDRAAKDNYSKTTSQKDREDIQKTVLHNNGQKNPVDISTLRK